MVKQNYKVIWDDEAKASLKRIYNYIMDLHLISIESKKVSFSYTSLAACSNRR